MAQLQPITLVAPGRYGLNLEAEYNLLDPAWATEATNAVVSDGGRLSARDGWSDQTTNAIAGTPSIDVMHELLLPAGTRTVISTAGSKLYKNIDDFTLAANDLTGAVTVTADNWHFANFNGYVLGVQDEHELIEWDGSAADFVASTIVSTGQPATPNPGNCCLGAFGRFWFSDDDNQTIWYSALLDHDDLTTANGAGYIDMRNIWTKGMDTITAIAAFGSNLVVFGKNHIVIWADGQGSAIGLNPTQMYVADTIEGTGCIARDSIQLIGEGDLWFLSRHGIQSLGRVMAERNNPTVNITKHVHTAFVGDIQTERSSDANLDAVRSCYSPEQDMYLLFLPTNDVIWCVHTAAPFNDGEGGAMPITKWSMGGSIKCGLARYNGDVLFGSSGVVGKYGTQQDNTSSYEYSFWTGWLDLGPDRWEFDFSGNAGSQTLSYETPGSAEYGTAQYNIDEYAGGLTLQRRNFPGTYQGQFIRLGNITTIDGFRFVTQQINLVPKLGRMVI
jgi:hypothetical protein